MKIRMGLVIVILSVALGLMVGGCSKTEGDKTAGGAEKRVVMKVGDQKIDAVILEKYLEFRPVPMNADNTSEMLKKRAEELAVEELLYQEALKLKLDQALDVRQKIREILNQKIMEEQVHKTVLQRKIEQPELQAYYDAHQSEFNRPEEIRVADVFIAVPKDASETQRAELKRKAEAALAEALASPNPNVGFLQSIQKYSDQPEKYAKGDTGFFSADGKPAGIDPRVVEAAFKLEKGGDIFPEIIEAEDGYHLIMHNGRRLAVNRPLEQVARQLERRMKNEEIRKKKDDFIQSLKAKTQITIDDKELAVLQEKLKVENRNRPQVSPGFPPMPGGGPPMPLPMEGRQPPPPMPMGDGQGKMPMTPRN